VLGWGRDLRNRLNGCKFPLTRDSGSRDRHVNKVCNGLVEDWGTQPEKLRRSWSNPVAVHGSLSKILKTCHSVTTSIHPLFFISR